VTHQTHTPARRFPTLALTLVALLVAAYAWPAAQTAPPPAAPAQAAAVASNGKKILTVDDYTKWRSIGGQEISGDGKWVSYGLSFTNTAPADAKPVLHLVNLGSGQDTEIRNATGANFSADSKWIAYQVDPSAAGRGGRGTRGGGGGGPGGTAPATALPASAGKRMPRARRST
jgi:hypothetical protein